MRQLTGRICIVSAGSLSSGPRVEKEADALAEAGFHVHVLVCHPFRGVAEWDAKLAASKAWTHETLFWGKAPDRRLPLWLATRAVQALSRSLVYRFGPRPGLAELAQSERFGPMLVRGRALRADLYIAHNLAALPVAAQLARTAGARLAFDAEDDHMGEFPEGALDSPEARLVDYLQSRYLPRCSHVTAASHGIAARIAERYGVPKPTVVHNVFPWSLRDQLDGRTLDRKPGGVSLYWFSQTIGLDRGLQDVIRAAGVLRGDFQIHLRGKLSDGVRRALMELAAQVKVHDRIVFHPQVHPTELPSRTAEHDIGLALEQPVSRNRLETVTNKLFLYMATGLALAATDTPGQRRVMESVPGAAGFLYAPGDWRALAERLQRWIEDGAALARARQASLEAARTVWCWEREQIRLIERVRQDLT